MKGTPAIYLGRIVDKKNFRAFIYGANGTRRLVESWEEFEANMQTGIWFATAKDAIVEDVKPARKTRTKQKPKAQPEPVEEVEDVLPDDDSVFEVTDDFLPHEGK